MEPLTDRRTWRRPTEGELEEYLSRPTPPAIRAMADLDGDLLVLGAGGKMGMSLTRMAVRASEAAGVTGRSVTAVSRFGSREARDAFEAAGVATISADLLDDGAIERPARTPERPLSRWHEVRVHR